ncbi:MAG: class I SAM-dependent methyltransferase [Simkaniaceae bacterium]|nr:MAG: class I SAM-dependent methyltransferase [Simkaniaceae bacterium]
MGVAKGVFKFLLELKTTTDKVHGKVLQLGRQCTYVSPEQMKTYATDFNTSLPRNFNINLSFDPKLNEIGYVDDITFFKGVGFDEVDSLDYSSYEGCSLVHDLNEPVPEEYYEKYDAIFDGGTLEHVFHFPNCLANIHKMLKPNGVIIHSSPSHNHVDHGFYMFSPTVFYDYYKSNNYNILKSNIFEYHRTHESNPWIIYNYEPGTIDHLSYGGWGNKLLGIWFVAEKMAESTSGIIPQQSFYTRTWNKNSNDLGRFKNLKTFIRKNPFLYRLARKANQVINFKSFIKKRPKVVARY